jgi:hypothetical protein
MPWPMLKIVTLACVFGSGYLLYSSSLTIRWRLATLAGVGAVALHLIVQSMLPANVLAQIPGARDHLVSPLEQSTWADPNMLVMVGLVTTAGLWVPAVFIPWISLKARLAIALFMIGAAGMAAIAYMGIDVFIETSDGWLQDPPPYKFGLLIGLPFSATAFATAAIVRRARQQRTVASRGGTQ